MMAEPTQNAPFYAPFDTPQIRLVGLTFGVITAILIAAYFLLMRFNFSIIYQGLEPETASSIVSELDSREIRYRLSNGGANISVPANQAAAARVAIAGADSTAKKTDGFELFNESEMGLTDFAQKIKFQRALQGELARTIMALEGVKSARVHVSIPERALFRGQDRAPKAAVTLTLKSGYAPTRARIQGVRELVSAAVPELGGEHVVILNNLGAVINGAYAEENAHTPAAMPVIKKRAPVSLETVATQGEQVENSGYPGEPEEPKSIGISTITAPSSAQDTQVKTVPPLTQGLNLKESKNGGIDFKAGTTEDLKAQSPDDSKSLLPATGQQESPESTAASKSARSTPKFVADNFISLILTSLIFLFIVLLLLKLLRSKLTHDDHAALALQLQNYLSQEEDRVYAE